MGLLPFYILRQFDNDGRLLSGGLINFYSSGTNVRKDTYTDFTLSTVAPNPVELDASGSVVGASNIWLGSGSYRVHITDLNGVQIKPPIDGITGGASFGVAGSNATFALCKLYQDLRDLTEAPDTVYVAGRLAEGDGGQGWFQLIPSSSLVDDNGIVLVSGSNVYQRVFDAVIDPRWYGLKYNNVADQTSSLNASLTASVQYNFPVLLADRVNIAQNISVPVGAQLIVGYDSYIYSSSAVTITFPTGTKLSGTGAIFGVNVSASLGKSVSDALRLSWFGADTDDTKWSKLIASTIESYSLLVDATTSITSDLTIPANFAVDFVAGNKINIPTTLVNISIANLVYTSTSQIFNYSSVSYIGTISLNAVGYFEWFGWLNGSNDNSIALVAGLKSGNIKLLGKAYVSTGAVSYTIPNDVVISGIDAAQSSLTMNASNYMPVADLNVTNMSLLGSALYYCDSFTATNCVVVASILNTNAASIDSCIVGPISSIGKSVNSVFSAFEGYVSGDHINGTFTLTDTMFINNLADFKACTFNKSEGYPRFISLTSAYDVSFTSCTFNIGDDMFIYSMNDTVDIYITSCKSNNDFSKALSNGYSKVWIASCGKVNNSTAYSIDGYLQEPSELIDNLASGSYVNVSVASTDWKGLGTVSSDGDKLILNSAASLGNTIASTNTIRYAGNNAAMNSIFKLGGKVRTTIIYPTGYIAASDSKVVVAFVIPTIFNTAGQIGYELYIHDNILGKSVGMFTGNRAIIDTNIWGGQVDFSSPNTAQPNFNISDMWGDVSQTVGSSTVINNVPRIVIYDEAGTVTMPIGTTIKVEIYAYLPKSREQFIRYWPEFEWHPYDSLTWTDLTNYSYIKTSLASSYPAGTIQFKTPYAFRDIDDNGLQVVIARKQNSNAAWSKQNLPVTTWFNGSTITVNNGFS